MSRDMRVHGDEDDKDGGGSRISPATRPQSAPQSAIVATEADIRAVEEEIEAVEAPLSGGPAAYLDTSNRGFLLKQLDGAQKKIEQLRDKQKQLPEEELVLLNKLHI